EYTEEGMSLDEATNEALKQMGDPNMLSELYKEKPYKYKGGLNVFLVTVFTFISIFSKAIYDRLNNFNIMDKSIVYKEGIFALNEFIPWGNIQAYRGDKLNKKRKDYYLLDIKVKGKILSRRAIKVSSFQVNLIEELFISKNIEKKRHF
ncbi:hypothetical protein, partial [Intestinibacter sp.]